MLKKTGKYICKLSYVVVQVTMRLVRFPWSIDILQNAYIINVGNKQFYLCTNLTTSWHFETLANLSFPKASKRKLL